MGRRVRRAFWISAALVVFQLSEGERVWAEEHAFLDPGLQYVVGVNAVGVTGYSGDSEYLEIPAEIEGLPVMGIGDWVFHQSELVEVTIPDSVTEIGDWALSSSWKLKKVTIGKGVRSLGYAVFSDCPNILEYVVDPENEHFASEGGVLFDKAMKTLISYPGGRSGAYKVLESVTRLKEFAFDSCVNLTGVVLPPTLEEIGEFGFGYCTRLERVTIPSSVRRMGGAAFAYCEGLEGVFFKGDAPEIPEGQEVLSASGATAFYLPGAEGWDATFDERPTHMLTLILTSEGMEIIEGVEGGFLYQFTVAGPLGTSIAVEGRNGFEEDEWEPVVEGVLLWRDDDPSPNGVGWLSVSEMMGDGELSRYYRVREL